MVRHYALKSKASMCPVPVENTLLESLLPLWTQTKQTKSQIACALALANVSFCLCSRPQQSNRNALHCNLPYNPVLLQGKVEL